MFTFFAAAESTPPQALAHFLNWTSLAIGAIGVAILLWGVAVALSKVIRVEAAALTGADVNERRENLRHELGYYLLLGLEFLVAADIVHTILTPTLHELAVLGAIVAIRTVISVSINWELAKAKQH